MKTNSSKKRVQAKRTVSNGQSKMLDQEKLIDDLKEMILESKRRVSLSRVRIINR